MSYAYLHLVLSHIPVLGIIIGALVLVYGFVRKSDEIKQTSLGIFILAALITIPVYLTGEPAEEIIEHLPGVSEAFIDQHEDLAIYALVLMEITGVLALINLVFYGRSIAKKLLVFTLLSSFVAIGSVLLVANTGGKIRHTEIRTGSSQTAAPEKQAKKEHDDDDDH